MRWTQVVRLAAGLAPAPAGAPPIGPMTLPAPAPGKADSRRGATTRDPALDLPLANWGLRFGSGVIDTIIAWTLTITVLVVASPGFLRQLGHLYMNYYRDFQTAWFAGTPTPGVPDAFVQQMSTLSLVAGSVTAVYCVLFMGTWGATLGQRLFGIKVIRAPLPAALLNAPDFVDVKPFTVEKPGWLRSVSKGVMWALFSTGGSLFLLVQLFNVLLPLWHKRKQSLTDLVATTLVISSKPSPPA